MCVMPKYPNSIGIAERRRQRKYHVIACGAPIKTAAVLYPGPSLPTRAEYRHLKLIGADLVGMSLVPEVLAAVHAGFQVLALAGVTQSISLERHTPTSIEDMLDAADIAAPRIGALLTGITASVR